VSVEGWRRASHAERQAAAEGFYNDSYWFDQAACSSPRAVFWVGEDPGAEEEFRTLLADVLKAKQHVTEPAMAVQKRVSAYGAAADGAVTAIEFDSGDGLATLELAGPEALPREWLGAGTFATARVGSLADLVPIVVRKDQTVSQFGFTEAELIEFVTALAGRGVDRVVPFGSALTFSAIWDGYDLLAEFSRRVTVKA